MLILLCACGQTVSPEAEQTATSAAGGAASTSAPSTPTAAATTGSSLRTMVLVLAPPASSVASGADSCRGTGVFASVAPGQVVRVLDGAHAVVAAATLGAGRRSGQAADGCIWSAEVTLPTDQRAYRAVIEGWGSSGLLSGENLHKPIEIRPSG
ncbi:MAG: hypothetical protein ACKOVB_03455 [Terrabacter sp.]